MTRSVARFVTWKIQRDTAEGAPPLFELECTTCLERSASGEDAGDAQQWALQHSGRAPSHTGFRGLTTSLWWATTGRRTGRPPS